MPRYRASEMNDWINDVTRSVHDALYETALNIFESLRDEGDPVTYPIHWDSERQKRAYFATDGFGSGIPYQRTGFYARAGTVERKPYGARLFKPHPSGAIGGTFSGWQSKIHQGRWKKIIVVVNREVSRLPQNIQARFKVLRGT